MRIVATKALRKATNVSLEADLLETAKKLGINISRSAEEGLHEAVAKRQAELWKQENRAAIQASNAYVENHGILLVQHRKF
ncbi:type II toxin-antitoxin system CcdA family antitoxin [Thalassospira alkalitolerans]|uniref:type II toxin-antitoxin system CcdA family antitoxin n=1 Tax=Thalassospira alkalitolerans TaxID=1293890 RepID=UPI0030EE2842|tara:strand:+ start:4721 stop:4963 length:243 start_codon:yes stop_codon:yes gene_type:complete